MSSQSTKKKKKGTTRRRFLRTAGIGTGLAVGVMYFGGCGLMRRSIAGAANTVEAPFMGEKKKPLVWFEITPDNRVTLFSPKVEMGQGTFTGLAQMAADEMDIDINMLEVVHAPTSSGNIDGFSTGGSTSISSLWKPLRELAATMREMIKTEGGKLLKVGEGEVSVQNGMVTAGSKSLSFGEIVKEVKEWKVPKTPQLKSLKEYKYIGKPIPRIDLEAKVMGEPIFGMDKHMPNMLFGSVARPDQVGVVFDGADVDGVEEMPGVVKVVLEEDFVGVVANSFTEAENARKAIKAKWKVEKSWSTSDIEDIIKVGKGKPIVIQKQGRAKRILNNEDDIISAEFTSPIGAHAQIEPNGALADVQGDKVDIYISTQVVSITRDEVAKRLGIKKEDVNIQPTYLGGGFGRRLHTPNAVQAAILSKAVGKPVKCFFDRKQEFQNDTFRPPTHHVLKAKLDTDGMIKAIEHNVSSGDVMFGSVLIPRMAEPVVGADIGAWRGGMIQYKAIPNFRAISWRVKLPFATSFWRSLGLLANTFAIESFMDELAIKTGQDPVAFRLAHIQDDEAGRRLRAVIEKAADQSGYKDELLPNGHALGFAVSTDANTPCAHVVEVSVEEKKIKVHKVTCVMDPGLAINPDQVKAQCEGSIIMGLSASLFEKMEVNQNKLSPTIYGAYEMALMKHAPKEIDVVILENAETPGAVGEPPLGPIGAAIANAVFRITGERLRSLPLQLS